MRTETELPHPAAGQTDQTRLRLEAETRLKTGATPPNKGWTLSTDALMLLYRLASTPERAGEALKLLHELQTHQVELDMQHAQLEANEHEYRQELARYRALYECAPVGYFVVDPDGRILESNPAGAALFGVAADKLGGRPVASLLAPESAAELTALLDTPRPGGPTTIREAQARDDGNGARRLRLAANRSPDGKTILLVVLGLDRSPSA